MKIGKSEIKDNSNVYIIGEIGINHNGDIENAKRLIDAAKVAGCNAVKFQKRTPELCVPKDQMDLKRETPWGIMTYLEYRRKVEFGYEEYSLINQYCKQREIDWFCSCWDVEAVRFVEQFDPVCYKLASASITDGELLQAHRDTGRPILLSTGMSTLDEVKKAVSYFEPGKLVLLHTTSAYPCKVHELNLRTIQTLRDMFQVPVGYSGHEVGLQTTYAAVALGACVVERHITLDRTMWGSDQAASVEPMGLIRLVRDIRTIEKALGDGQKRVYDSEIASMKKLRKVKQG